MNEEGRWITTKAGNRVFLKTTDAYMNSKIKQSISKKVNNEPEDFQDSKIRDKNGNLMKVYHGSQTDFEQFDEKYIRERPAAYISEVKGFYFCTKKRKEAVAGYYAGDKGTIKEAYLNIKNPLYVKTSEFNEVLRQEIQSGRFNQYDGIVTIADNSWTQKYYDYDTDQVKEVTNEKGDIVEIIAFDKNQIKVINSKKRS